MKWSMNNYILYEDYAEIILYDKYGNEKARALIDLDDVKECRQFRWCYDRYVRNWKIGSLHRFILKCTSENIVDHINHNVLDNRKNNLRICGVRENSINKCKMSNNTSGITGVYWKKDRNKWGARIVVNGKCIYLGYFVNKEDAIKIRKEAEVKYFGEYRYKGEE